MLRIFENIRAERKSIYKVDVLTAIRWVYEEWCLCPAEAVQECFTHVFKAVGKALVARAAIDDVNVLQRIERDSQEHNIL